MLTLFMRKVSKNRQDCGSYHKKNRVSPLIANLKLLNNTKTPDFTFWV